MVQNDSSKDNLFVGIDIAKKTLEVFIASKSFNISNDETTIADFAKTKLAPFNVVLCVLESTGGYENVAINVLHKAGIPVHCAHPNRVYAFAKASNHFAKTDKLDALLLSKYAKFVHENHGITGDASHDVDATRLQELRRLACTIEEESHAVQCRIQQYGDKYCLRTLNKQLIFYKNQLADIEQKMQTIIGNNEDLSKKSKIMQTMTGVGERTARNLLAELPELGTLSNKKISCLAGVIPKTYESGTKIGRGKICGGRFYARKALYMSALVASKACPIMSKKYQDLQQRGKAKKVALVALMHKILITLNSMIRDMKEFSYATA